MKKIKCNLSHNSTKANILLTQKSQKQPLKCLKNITNKNQSILNHCQSVQKIQNFPSTHKIHDKQFFTNSKTLRLACDNSKQSKQNIFIKNKIVKQKKSYFGIRNQKLKRAEIDLTCKKPLIRQFSSNNILVQEQKSINCELLNNDNYTSNKPLQLHTQYYNYTTVTQPQQIEQNKSQFIRLIIDDLMDDIFDKNVLELRRLQGMNKRLEDENMRIYEQYKKNEEDNEREIKRLQELLRVSEQLKSERMQLQRVGYKQRIIELEQSLQRMRNRQEENRQKMNELNKVNSQIDSEIKKLKNQLIVLQKQNETFKKELCTIKKQLGINKKQNINLKKNIQQSDILIKQLQQKLLLHQTKYSQTYNLSKSLEYQLQLHQNQIKKTSSQKYLQFQQLLITLKNQNFHLLKNYNSILIKIQMIQKKYIDQIDKIKYNHAKQSKNIKQKNRKLIKNNMILKRMIQQQKTDSIEFFLEDNPTPI